MMIFILLFSLSAEMEESDSLVLEYSLALIFIPIEKLVHFLKVQVSRRGILDDGSIHSLLTRVYNLQYVISKHFVSGS